MYIAFSVHLFLEKELIKNRGGRGPEKVALVLPVFFIIPLIIIRKVFNSSQKMRCV